MKQTVLNFSTGETEVIDCVDVITEGRRPRIAGHFYCPYCGIKPTRDGRALA